LFNCAPEAVVDRAMRGNGLATLTGMFRSSLCACP
jgi:hypothetical protein